ncbi:homocysteine S-methyltransferase family protein [soil metagenome]
MMTTAKYRHSLPQRSGPLFLTDGGIETTLIFQDGFDLSHFAAFPLLRTAAGRAALVRYFEGYIAIAQADGLGFVLESPTWRASTDWGSKLGFAAADIVAVNREAIDLMQELRAGHETAASPMVVSGCIGPRGDGYDPGLVMEPDAAEAYHTLQVAAFAETQADMVTAITLTNANEAIGIVRAAQKAGMPVAIAFTVETDGRLPTGQSLADAICEVDIATGSGPAYYMISCAHPTHFQGTLDGDWTHRIAGLRANASKRSHQELNESADLDDGNPMELGGQYRELVRRFPDINVLGGCCGTDHRHIECIALACREVRRPA